MTAATDLFFAIKAAIRMADQSDRHANDIGESEYATALRDLKAELVDFIAAIDEIVSHQHRWNENDYCSICGADGRA